MLSLSEHVFCHEMDRVIGCLDRRLAEQCRQIETLRAAHKPAGEAEARLRLLGESRGRLLGLRSSFGANAPAPNALARNQRHRAEFAPQ